MALRKDIWRSAIIDSPIAEIVARGGVDGLPVHWLPPMPSFQFLADPFAVWRNGKLHIFVEAYDYRVRVGTIEVLVYDAAYQLVERHPILAEPWHLSYPQVFEAEGETWMLPEAHRSGRLTLYRAVDFPRRWEAAHVLDLGHPAVDATPVFHDGLWWLFYTSTGTEAEKMGALNIAFADRLAGPWCRHPGNPVRIDMVGGRPGGTAFVMDSRLVLPVQDCSRTYGGAIRALTIERLTTEVFEATLGPPLLSPASFAPYVEGLHTLASAGPVTLIDVKRTELSLHGLSIEIRREARKLWN